MAPKTFKNIKTDHSLIEQRHKQSPERARKKKKKKTTEIIITLILGCKQTYYLYLSLIHSCRKSG